MPAKGVAMTSGQAQGNGHAQGNGERPTVYRKAYLAGPRPDIRVPVREVSLTNGSTFTLYDTSGPYQDPGFGDGHVLPALRAPWIAERKARGGVVTQRAAARRGEVTPEME